MKGRITREITQDYFQQVVPDSIVGKNKEIGFSDKLIQLIWVLFTKLAIKIFDFGNQYFIIKNILNLQASYIKMDEAEIREALEQKQ